MLLVTVGFIIGGLGALVGVGGGFLLVPFLLHYAKDLDASQVVAIGLFCVALNGLSASIQHVLKKQLRFKLGLLFSICSLPAAWWSTTLVQSVDRKSFELSFATLMFMLAIFLLLKKPRDPNHHASQITLQKYILGAIFSALIGLMSFFGVGGGVFYVPYLVYVVGLPVHVATGTSQFIIAIAASVATFKHYSLGHLNLADPIVMYLSVGMILGSQVSSYYSKRVTAKYILYTLAVIIIMMSVQFFIKHLI